MDHEVAPEAVGPGAMTSWLRRYQTAFRDRVVVLEDVAVDEDFVSVRWIGSLAHVGEFLGYAPSGETIELAGVDVFRVEDGRIAERWSHEAGLGLKDQLELRALRLETRARLHGIRGHDAFSESPVLTGARLAASQC